MFNFYVGRLAANLIHKFRFDGIRYDRCVDTSTGAIPIVLDLQVELPKMALVWDLLNGNRDELPDDILEADEKCALHWMISYSVNTTFREEEFYYNNRESYSDYQSEDANFQPPSPDYQNDIPLKQDHFSVTNKGVIKENVVYNPEQPMTYNCDERRPKSYFPLEMGVIWTRAGPVSGASIMAGLAAGLRPQFEYWPTTPSSGSSRRRIENYYGVTLAADVAQTALRKKRGQKYVGPDGYFNNSLCPSEFLLTSEYWNGEPTFTHLTIAEINGGIDGLILGLNAEDWERKSEMALSQVLYPTSLVHLKTTLILFSTLFR